MDDHDLRADRRSKSAVVDVSVPDSNPRFTAPFRIVRGSENTGDHASERWVAGGNAVWSHDLGFSTTREQAETLANHGWTRRTSLGTPGRMVVGLDAVADPSAKTVYLVLNGYNRRFIEGPGAAQDHVWKGVLSKTGGVTWTNESAGTPDVPATDVLRLGDKLVVGRDYGVMVGALNASRDVTGLKRVGGNSGAAGALPLTTVFDITAGPDGYLYAATPGRGIWKTPVNSL